MKLNPFNEKTDPMNYTIFENFRNSIGWDEFKKDLVKEISNTVKKEIDAHIKECEPDLLVSFGDIYKELTRMIQDFDSTVKDIEKKAKKVFESSTLTEDVYKMRDDLAELKKSVMKFNANVKKIFK